MNARWKNPFFLFFLIFCAGFAVRLWYLLDFASLPLLEHVTGPDVSEYLAAARRVRAGEWLPPELQIHAPLYSWVLAFFLWICPQNLFPVRLLQSSLFLGLLLLPLFRILHRRYGGLSCAKRLIPYGACLLLALYPPLVIYQCDFYSENLMLVLLLWSLWCFTLHSKSASVWSGLFCGAALIAHPGCVFFVPAAALWWLLRDRSAWKKCILRTLVFLAGTAAMVFPVCAWNTHLASRLVFIQENGAFNYYLGNNPASTGTCYISPGARWEKEHAYAGYRAKKQGISTDRFFLGESFSYLTEQPLRFAAKLFKKGAMSLSAREFTTWSDATPLKLIFWHRHLYQGWFLPLLLFGGTALTIGLFRRRFRRSMSLELLLFASVFAGQVFFLTAGRYRLPLTVPLAVFAVYFFCAWREFIGSPRRTAYTLMAMIVLCSAALYPYAIAREPEEEYARSLLAGSFVRAGNPKAAIAVYADAPRSDAFPDRKAGILGRAFYDIGDRDRAEKYFLELIRNYPSQAEGYVDYASLLSDSNRFAEAEKYLNEARSRTARSELLADIEFNLGEIAQRTGKPGPALEHYRKAVSLLPAHRKALNNAGTLLIRGNRPAEALPFFERAVMLEPGNARLLVNLALAQALSGKKESALATLNRALAADPDCAPARQLLRMLSEEKR
ncbi:MAG: photosystem I assembly protein Ycf3 [Lentisphaerae bacterium ADurb.Bin242]|nr:MAG: photosystem I assembly protein Ycf3 [Lentisphaerae bacterium ADurb.Bin242]